MSPDDRALYVISCRKAAPGVDVRAEGASARFTTPKRPGTYVLLRGTLSDDIREGDLYRVAGGDTDVADERQRSREANAHVDWRARQGDVEESIARTLQELPLPIVLYVHGFNTRPDEALQAGVKLQGMLDAHTVAASVVVFTWPSAGHLADYFPDQKSAGRFGSYALVNLLMSLRRVFGPRAVHCVAHSMGTYVVTRALGTITTVQLDRSAPGPVLGRVAYMQPDIDYDILCSGYAGPAYESPSYLEIPDGYGATTMVDHLTIYYTGNDMALFASLFKNRTKRLGAYGPGMEGLSDREEIMRSRIRPNVNVVNCDEGCVLDWRPQHSHSHFLECPQMQADLVSSLTGSAAPARSAVSTRWYELQYRQPLPAPGVRLLIGLAAFWTMAGNAVLNRVVVLLVKWKKRFQTAWAAGKGFVLTASGTFTGVTGAVAMAIRQPPVWLVVVAIASAALLLTYFVTLMLARRIQVSEDRSARFS